MSLRLKRGFKIRRMYFLLCRIKWCSNSMNKCTFYLAIVFTSAIESRKCTVLARTILEEGVWCGVVELNLKSSGPLTIVWSNPWPSLYLVLDSSSPVGLASEAEWMTGDERRWYDMMGVMLLWVITIWCNCRAEAVLLYYIIKQYHQMCAFIQSYVVLYARSPPTFRNFQVRSKRTFHSDRSSHLSFLFRER